MQRKALIILALVLCIGAGAAARHLTRPKPSSVPDSSSGPESWRHDPIQDDPNVRPFILMAAAEADAEVQKNDPLGGAPARWRITKRILKEKYGIDWRTLAEMNPEVTFH